MKSSATSLRSFASAFRLAFGSASLGDFPPGHLELKIGQQISPPTLYDERQSHSTQQLGSPHNRPDMRSDSNM